jgi:hypothetical protein
MDRIAKHSSSEKLVFADFLISISFVSDSLAGPTSVQVIPLCCDVDEATDNSAAQFQRGVVQRYGSQYSLPGELAARAFSRVIRVSSG